MSKFFVIAVVLGIIFAIQIEAKAQEDNSENKNCTSEDCHNDDDTTVPTTVPTNVLPDVISDIDKIVRELSDEKTDKNTIANDINKLLQSLEKFKGTKLEGIANILARLLKRSLTNLHSSRFFRMAKFVIKGLEIFKNAYRNSHGSDDQPNF